MVRLLREATSRKAAKRQRAAAEDRARELGFTADLVPFIASSYLILCSGGWTPTVREVTARTRAQVPWLFENAAQGQLWDEDAAFVETA